MALSLRNAVRSLVINTALIRELMQSGVAYNPTSVRLAQDPDPICARLRERDPVHRSRLMNAWVFSRHADVDAILRDQRRFASDPRKRERARRQRQVRMGSEDYSMLFLDPPDRLDVTRHPRSHVAFGRGIHHCLGAPLALLEGRIVIEMLLERFASMRLLTDRPTFRNSVVLRGLESLPIAATPA